MAKALMGHLPGIDPRAAQEIATLRRRIAVLESQVDDLQTAVALAQSEPGASGLGIDGPLDLDHEMRTLDAEHAASTV